MTEVRCDICDHILYGDEGVHFLRTGTDLTRTYDICAKCVEKGHLDKLNRLLERTFLNMDPVH